MFLAGPDHIKIVGDLPVDLVRIEFPDLNPSSRF